MPRLEDRDERPNRPRIFGIGLNKTATTSLDRALSDLGFRSLHDGGDPVHKAVMRAVAEEVPLLSYLDQRFDAFSDIGMLARRFRMLDRQYPGSRFLLTVRPIDAWLDSRRRHVERNIELQAAGKYDGTFVTVDIPKWTREWHDQTERVHAYFAGRADFLEIDFTSDPSWGRLCAFLDVDEPATPFPWVNRDAKAR